MYRWLYADALFRFNERERTVYLTFDDGPHPEATPAVLDVLEKHGIKATFFLLGKNVVAHPEIVESLKTKGHTIGNHGMNHLNGWNTSADTYAKDVMAGKELTGSSLFRPPYGKLTFAQYRMLRKTEKLVFWDVISGDFDQHIGSSTVINNVLKNVGNGSIIVMHDSKKAMNNVMGSLNEIIVKLKQDGFCFKALPASSEPQ